MSQATESIFPIEHGKLTTVLDANNLQIVNLDTSNLPLTPGSGNDTGTTTAILKGDGNHGFADAIVDQDYASVGSVQLRELSDDHDADITAVNDELSTLNTALVGISGDVADKADLTYVDTQLSAKEDITGHDADITSVNNAIADVASDLATLTTAVGNKADSASVSAALAAKENLLPITASDGFVLVRDADDTWRFVDPVTLGSTNATYGDGATHSNTTFNSTLAVFTAADVGLTIVATGDLDTDTTIAAFVNATTVTLNQPALTTASGITFVMLNRFLPSGGTGTVTSVGVNNPALGSGGAADLLTIGVTNATTSAVINFSKPTVVGNTFYGNSGGPTAIPTFMSAAAARTALGGTTVGQAVFQLANPSQVGFIQTNANNTVTALTLAATMSALGAESALTFSAPLTRTLNTITLPVVNVSPAQDGYLTSTDYATFQAKVPPGRSITTTAPLTIGGVSGGTADLSVNRTIAMPASTGNADGTLQVNGYLTGADHTLFANKPPNSRTLAVTAPLTMSPGTVAGNTTTGDLSANRTVAIPKATSAVDGYLAATDFLRFSGGAGTSVVTAQTVGTLTIDPLAVPPVNKIYITAALTGVLNIVLPPATPYAAATLSIEIIDVVTGGATAAPAAFITVSKSGSDSIDGATSITLAKASTYQRLFPNVNNKWFSTKYFVESFKDASDPTKKVIIDVSGIATATTRTLKPASGGDSVTVVPNDGGATPNFVTGVNANGTLVTSEVDYSDITGTPAVPDPSFQTLVDGSIIALTCDSSRINQNARVSLAGTSQAKTLRFDNLFDGAMGELRVTQAGGGSNSLVLPAGSRTPANGLGVISLSSAVGAVDKVRWSYGATEGVMMEVVGTNYTAAVCNTSVDASTVGANVSPVGNLVATIAVAAKYIPTQSFVSCKITLDIAAVLSPSGNLTVSVFADDGVTLNGKPTGVALATSDPVPAPTITTPTTITFPNFAYSFGVGTTYWIVLKTSAANNSSNYTNWYYNNVAAYPFYRADAAEATWIQAGTQGKFRMTTYK